MASFNKVILLGNLTRDPELRYAPNGTAVASFGMATNRRSGQGDDRKEEVCFVDVVAFGRDAEMASEYLSKGRMVLIEGRLQWRSWETQDGQKRSKHEVIAERMQFMPRGQDGGERTGPGSSMERPSPGMDRPSPGMDRPASGTGRPSTGPGMERARSGSARPAADMNFPSSFEDDDIPF